MKDFKGHRFVSLCRLQMREITVLDWIAPFFVMGLLLFLVNIGVDSSEEWLKGMESQVMVYFNLGILEVCCGFFARFFKRRNGYCKLSLPGSALEKWSSLWTVALLMLLYWFVLGFLADGIMLLVGTQFYNLTVCSILEEYRVLYMNSVMSVFYLIMAAGSAFVITAANTVRGQGKTVFFAIVAFASFFAVIYFLPEAVLPVVFVVSAVVLLVSGYFIFKQTVMNTKELI